MPTWKTNDDTVKQEKDNMCGVTLIYIDFWDEAINYRKLFKEHLQSLFSYGKKEEKGEGKKAKGK